MGGDIEASFKKMRRSARDFITAAGPESLNFSNDHRHFMACLEAMRVSIGTEIVWLAAEYKILMEDDFARSLPIRDLSWIATFEDENGNPA